MPFVCGGHAGWSIGCLIPCYPVVLPREPPPPGGGLTATRGVTDNRRYPGPREAPRGVTSSGRSTGRSEADVTAPLAPLRKRRCARDLGANVSTAGKERGIKCEY